MLKVAGGSASEGHKQRSRPKHILQRWKTANLTVRTWIKWPAVLQHSCAGIIALLMLLFEQLMRYNYLKMVYNHSMNSWINHETDF